MRIDCNLSEWRGEDGRCQWCNKSLAGQSRRKVWCSKECGQAFETNHIWNIARHKARRRAGYKCTRENCPHPKEDLEVNHIIPLVGAGYGPSCFHHSANLEVLCKPHHQVETNRQRTERKEAKNAGVKKTQQLKLADALRQATYDDFEHQNYGGTLHGSTSLVEGNLDLALAEQYLLSEPDAFEEVESTEIEKQEDILTLTGIAPNEAIPEIMPPEITIPDWMARRNYKPITPRHPADLLPKGSYLKYDTSYPARS